MLKKWKLQECGSGLLLLLCGLILLLNPELTLTAIANLVGGIVIVIGAIYLICFVGRRNAAGGSYDLIKGLIIVAAGIFICVRSAVVVSILPVIMGIGMMISGLLKLQHGLALRRMGFSTWKRIGITAIINILIGLLVVLNPFSTAAWLMRVIGIGFIFSGVTDLITTLYVSKKESEYYVDGKAEERP